MGWVDITHSKTARPDALWYDALGTTQYHLPKILTKTAEPEFNQTPRFYQFIRRM
jgi:hypothetical protein